MKYTQHVDSTGEYVYQDYAEWCKDPSNLNIPPTPCSNTYLKDDTIWINRPGTRIVIPTTFGTIRATFVPTYPGGPWIPRDGGGEQFCNGPCQVNVDYISIPVFADPSSSFPVRCEEGTFPYYTIINYAHSSFRMRLDSTVTIRYENGNAITAASYNYYDREADGTAGHYQLTRDSTVNSDGSYYVNRIYYPDDIDLDLNLHPGYGSLALFNTAEKDVIRLLGCHQLHRIGIPILQESYVNGTRTFLQKNSFTDLGFSSFAGLHNGNIVMPLIVKTSLGDENELKTVIEYHEYDAIGNPLEISRGQDGPHISFRWGHNNTYVIERIDNATKTEVDAALSQVGDIREDGSLGEKVMVNSYVYEYRYGKVSKIIDPNGRATTFSYDGFGRLVKVIDHNGNLRSLTEYNLKQP